MILKNFSLTIALAWTDFKLRYKGSMLGFFWSFLKPLFMLSVLYIIFALVIKSSIQNYVLYLLLGILLWNYFVESTSISMHNLFEKRGLIRSVYFPRQVLVISSNMNAALTLGFNLLIFFIIFIFYKISLSWGSLIFLLMLALLFLFSLGVSYILSALYVRYRDVSHIWEIITQAGFWITPIIYSVAIIPKKYTTVYLLNPMARIITYSRDALIGGNAISFYEILITAVLCAVVYLIGNYLYSGMSRRFGEEL